LRMARSRIWFNSSWVMLQDKPNCGQVGDNSKVQSGGTRHLAV